MELEEVHDNRETKAFQPKKKKRVFKLELTDGFKTVYGMEYTVIPSLSTKLSPGCKLKISGPLQCVNHILFLESKNIELLGGDVESLQIKNAYENVLLRALGKEETETPILDYREPPAVTESQNRGIESAHQSSVQVKPPPVSSRRLVTESEEQAELAGIAFDDDSDEFDMAELEKIAEVENQFRTSQEEDRIRADPEIVQIPESYSSLQSMVPSRPLTSERITNNVDFIDVDLDSDDGDFKIARQNVARASDKKIAKIAPTRKPEFTFDTYEFKTVGGLNLVTIDQYLQSMKPSDRTNRDYVIFADLENFNSNTLKVYNDEWQLQSELSDVYSRLCLEVKFHNDVIDKFLGYTAKEMKEMYSAARASPQIREEIVNIFRKLSQKFQDQSRFMSLRFSYSLDESSSIVEVFEISDNNQTIQADMKTLEKKIHFENVQKRKDSE